MPYILQTDRLTKIIGEKELVRDVDLHVRKGEIYGFLGPNGAAINSTSERSCGTSI